MERLARAKGYPYPRPSTSFIFVASKRGSAYHEIKNAAWRGADALPSLLDLKVGAPIPTGSKTGVANSSSALLGGSAGSSSSSTDLRASSSTAGGGGDSCSEFESRWQLRRALQELHGIDADELLPPGTPFTPILAIGSNAGPEQLARKFPPDLFPQGAVIPVIQCVLDDFDVVYAPLISSYGSATATLEASPGARVEVFVTYLAPPLQQRMHETEGAYDLLRLDGVRLQEGAALEGGGGGGGGGGRMLSSVYQYNHCLGTLHLPLSPPRGPAAAAASPIALAEIPAKGRRFPALSQVEMQLALMRGFNGGDSSSSRTATSSGDGAGDETDVGGIGGAASSAAAGAQPMDCQGPGQPAAGVLLAPVSLPVAAAASAMVPSSSSAAAPGPSASSTDSGPPAGGGGGCDGGLDDFIMANLLLPDVRKARVAALAAHARAFSYERHERLLSIGSMFSKNVD